MASKPPPQRTAAEQVWETRTQMVKRELAAESAANDAKTARLRALRLAREAEEARAAEENGTAAAPARKKKRAMRRIVTG
jgi:hypothetical protein